LKWLAAQDAMAEDPRPPPKLSMPALCGAPGGVRDPDAQDPRADREVAGRVEAVGAEVTTLAVGNEVFGIAEGSFAEYARARAGKLAPRPSNLTYARPRRYPYPA
jgi:hypothetical protein